MIAWGQHQFSTASGNGGDEPEITGISPRRGAIPDRPARDLPGRNAARQIAIDLRKR